MTAPLQYDPAAARRLLERQHFQSVEPSLLKARADVLSDVDLLRSGAEVPPDKRPLDAGFIELPHELLSEFEASGDESLLGRIQTTAERLRNDVDRVVLLGIGGSYMGARALFEALCDPYHNDLSREDRQGVPRLYFEGNNLDNDASGGLLRMLRRSCKDSGRIGQRWAVVVISKSGGTLETAVAFRLFRDALEMYYGGAEAARPYVVPVTGRSGKLRELSEAAGYPDVFPIPEGVGGRFSIFTAVGLLPAAILGLDIVALLRGAAEMTERFRTQPIGDNPVLDYTAVCHLLETEKGMTTRILSTWGSRLEAVGLWYDQLLAESLGKHERGATPITVVNTRDLHSRGQQHQEGTRDKLVTNVLVQSPASEPIPLPVVPDERDQDDLNRLAGRPLPEFLAAAFAGTNRAYADDGRPTADILFPRLHEHTLGQLLQMLMLATVVEGRLIGINPYGQPGVEAYKRNMNEILSAD